MAVTEPLMQWELDDLEALVSRREARGIQGWATGTLLLGTAVAVAALVLPWRGRPNLIGMQAKLGPGPGSGWLIVVLLALAATAVGLAGRTWVRPRPEDRTPLAVVALVLAAISVPLILRAPHARGLATDGTRAPGPWLALAGVLVAGAAALAAILDRTHGQRPVSSR